LNVKGRTLNAIVAQKVAKIAKDPIDGEEKGMTVFRISLMQPSKKPTTKDDDDEDDFWGNRVP
jgi:hypothetical protein